MSRQAAAPRSVKRHVRRMASDVSRGRSIPLNCGRRGREQASRDGNISRKEAGDLKQFVRLRTGVPHEEEYLGRHIVLIESLFVWIHGTTTLLGTEAKSPRRQICLFRRSKRWAPAPFVFHKILPRAILTIKPQNHELANTRQGIVVAEDVESDHGRLRWKQ